MVDDGCVGRSVQDVVLEQILAGGHVTVEEVGAAVVRLAVGHQVVVDTDEGKADLTNLILGQVITVTLDPSLDPTEVIGDAGPEVMNVVVLNVDHPVLDTVVPSVLVADDVHGAARGPGHLVVGNQDAATARVEHGVGLPVAGDAHAVKIVIRDGDILVIRTEMEDSVISYEMIIR